MENSKLSRAAILYSYQRSDVCVVRECPMEVNGVVTGESIVDARLTETIQPVNPVTGWRDNAISRLLSPNTPDVERQVILSSLTKLKGKNSPKELSDDDLLDFMPSRYCTDPVELERFRQSVEQFFAPVDSVEPVEPVDSPPADAGE